MPISFACPSCAKPFRVPDEFAGRSTKCTKCGGLMKIPRRTGFKQPPVLDVVPAADTYFTEPAQAAPAPVRRGGGGKLFLVGCLLFLMLGTMALAAGGAAAYFFVLAPGGSGPGDDVRYLPDNPQFVASIKPEQLMGSKAFQDIVKELSGPEKDFDKMFESQANIRLDNITQITVGGTYDSKNLIAVIRTNKPINPGDIKKPATKETTVGRFTIHEGPVESYCLVDPQLAVFGPTETLRKVLQRDKKPDIPDGLQAALKQVDFSKSMVLAFNFKELQLPKPPANPAIGGNPFGFESVFKNSEKMAKDVEGLACQLHVGTDFNLTIALLCKDAKTADEYRRMTDGLLVLYKKLLQLFISDETVAGDLAALMEEIKVTSNGNKVSTNARIGLPTILKMYKEGKKAMPGMDPRPPAKPPAVLQPPVNPPNAFRPPPVPADPEVSSDTGDPEKKVGISKERIEPLDFRPRLNIQFTKESNRFGISCTDLRDALRRDKPKLLTRDERGLTNNTCIFIDGFQYIYGHELPGVRYVKDSRGRLQREVKIGDNKWLTVMEIERDRVQVTQTIEIVVGEQTRLLDTVLVRYKLKNADAKPHTVGLRIMLDTFIGANDGVPFLIPPTETTKGYVMDTMKVFEQKDVPEFIRAVENSAPDAVVAEMGLKLAGVEPVHRLVICRWPENAEARWDWRFTPMNQPAGREKDSCLVLYWDKLNMNPGEARELAFTYGLGRISTTGADTNLAGGGKLRLLTGGSCKRGRTFVATAYVKQEGGKVTLRVPAGLTLLDAPEQDVPPAGDKDGYSLVSWRVKSSGPGTFTIHADHANIGSAKVDVVIRENSLLN